MPRSRFDELAALAEDNDGLVTAAQARRAGFTTSVLARLAQRARIERIARGVYRIPHYPASRFSHYREAVLWAQANRGPQTVALSRASALAVYGISDANPSSIHLTVPKSARLRRRKRKGLVVHREDLAPEDVTLLEGIPVTTINRTITDLLRSGGRIDLARQAVSGARREGFIGNSEVRQLRRKIDTHIRSLKTTRD
ncbi:MAG: type IV toxin-antitoxin system AbiEi family antitoxin domain-containing protein [Acidobacteriota bacterium]